MLKTDVLGHVYDDAEPAFVGTLNGQFYYHVKTKKLYDADTFYAQMKAAGKEFDFIDQLGVPSAGFIATRGDMLEGTEALASVPNALSAIPDGQTMDLAWTDTSGGTCKAYIRASSASSSGPWTEFIVVDAADEAVAMNMNLGATEYFYEIYSLNTSGLSSSYNTASGTTA